VVLWESGALLPVRFSPSTRRISLRSARSRRRRKETDVYPPREVCPIEAIFKTPRERAEEKRQEKLDLVREQVDDGYLVIRKMTKDERRRYPPKPDQPPKGSARR
jgi:hypothetical protein